MDSSSPTHISDLSSIIKNCWADFQELKNLETTVEHSIPILWFGDLEAYNRSTVKIMTVALNPSNKEFHDKKHSKSGISLRFPAAESLAGKNQLDDSDVAAYYKAMNEYFEKKPYMDWFENFEKPLNVLNATYYEKKAEFTNRAIHIDLMTPIATNPTWGNKKLNRVPYLETSHYFEDLKAIFKPQIILVSVGQKYIRKRLDDKFHEGETYVVPSDLKDGSLMIAGRNMMGNPFRGPGMSDVYVRERMLAIKRKRNLYVGESGTVQSTKANESAVANDVHSKIESGREESVVDERKVGEIAKNDFRVILESGRVPDDEIEGENLQKLKKWYKKLQKFKQSREKLPLNVCMVEAFLFCSDGLKQNIVCKRELEKIYCELSHGKRPDYTSYCSNSKPKPAPQYNARLFEKNEDQLQLRENARKELKALGWTTCSTFPNSKD